MSNGWSAAPYVTNSSPLSQPLPGVLASSRACTGHRWHLIHSYLALLSAEMYTTSHADNRRQGGQQHPPPNPSVVTLNVAKLSFSVSQFSRLWAKNRLIHETNDTYLFLSVNVLIIEGFVHSLCVGNGEIQFGEFDIVAPLVSMGLLSGG